MTTGPLFSCELPLTNHGPNDFTDAFPPENKYKFYFKFFQKTNLQFKKWVNFVWCMDAIEERQEKMFLLTVL